MVIGEALAQGKFMYRDVWDFTGPLAAGTYGLIHLIAGKSTLAYQTISALLVLIQAGIFNSLLIRNKAYSQNTYVPALMYVLFMHLSFDFFTLSPVLLGMTFVLLAINSLFLRMDNTTRDNLFIRMGLFLGIATLFYLPLFLYFVVIMLSLFIYTGSVVRRMFLLLYGFVLMLAIVALYYFWFDALALYNRAFFQSVFNLSAYHYLSWAELAGLAVVPFSIFAISYVRALAIGRFVNFQVRIQHVMLFFMAMGLLSLVVTKELATYQLAFLVPGFAFFSSHYLILLKKWIVAEANFIIIASLILLNMLFPLKKWLYVDEFIAFDRLAVQPSPYLELTSGKTLWVIGDHVDLYHESTLATPYLNWQLAAEHLSNTSHYDNLSAIYLNLQSDLPEVIVDEKGLVPVLFDKLPTIASKYTPHPEWKNVYVKN